MEKRIIGEIIADEVRRQGLSMEEFADKIYCSRQNVYNIFKRNTIGIAQLQIISKVLRRNFFADLANDPELAGANDPEVEKELKKRWAVAQFFDAMPRVLKNLEIKTSIVMPLLQNEYDDPLPDYGLSDYAVFFTVGERLYDRFERSGGLGLFEVQTETTIDGQTVDIWHDTVNYNWFADVKLDFKTEQQWGNIIVFLFDAWMPAIKMHFNNK